MEARRNERKITLVTLNIGSLNKRKCVLAEMLRKRRVDIACVQEAKIVGATKEEICGGYMMYYMGNYASDNGVAILVAENLRKTIVAVHRTSDRIMSLKLKIGQSTVNVVSCYAPQQNRGKIEKNAFYELLENHIRKYCKKSILLIGGDFNGHVGKEKSPSSISHGGYGYGTINSEGERLLEFADASNYVLVNTQFEKSNPKQLITYRSGNAKSQIDFWIVRKEDADMVLDCEVIPEGKVTTQHDPLLLKLSLRVFKGRKQNRSVDIIMPLLSLTNDKNTEINSTVLTPVSVDWNVTPDENYEKMVTAIKRAARDGLGSLLLEKDSAHNMWHYPENASALMHKYAAFTKWEENQKSYHAKHAKKQMVKEEAKAGYKKKKVAANKAVSTEITTYCEQLYNSELVAPRGENVVCTLTTRDYTQYDSEIRKIKDVNGFILKTELDITKRWEEHFGKLFEEGPSHRGIPEIQAIRAPTKTVPKITTDEVRTALATMDKNKAVGPDGVSAEIFKNLGESATIWLSDLFNMIVDQGHVPKHWKMSITVPKYSGEGDIMSCSTYKPKLLWCHSMEIFERILDKRLRKQLMVIVGTKQGGNKASRGMDAVFAARMLMEKHREKENVILHMIFLELSFDRISHQLISYAMRKFGVPEQYVKLVLLLHTDVYSYVRSAAGKSEPYALKTGMYRGSALLPLLILVCRNVFLEHIPSSDYGLFPILDSKVAMLCSTSRETLEQIVGVWNHNFTSFGLMPNLRRSTYMEMGAEKNSAETICVNGYALTKTKSELFFGAILSADGDVDDDVKGRINAAWRSWRKVEGLMCDKRIPNRLKSQIYRTIVRPIALDGAECWPLLERHEKLLQSMETRMLRWSFGCKRLKVLSYKKMLDIYGIVSITLKAMEVRMRWLGHVMRAEEGSLAKAAFELEVDGKNKPGRPRHRWLDMLKKDLNDTGLSMQDTANRSQWIRDTEQLEQAATWDQAHETNNREGDATFLQALEEESGKTNFNGLTDDSLHFFGEFVEMLTKLKI